MKKFTSFMLQNWISAAVISLLLLLGASCKEQILVDAKINKTTGEKELFTIEEGRLVFRSGADLRKQMDVFKTFTASELKQWNAKLSIRSLYTVAHETPPTPSGTSRSAARQDNDLLESVNDPYFASILNDVGEVAFGKNVVRVTSDYVLIGKKSLINKMRQMDLGKYKSLGFNKHTIDDGVLVGRVSHLEKHTTNARAAFNGITHSIYDWDDRHRSATVIYNDNWLIYCSIGTKVKFQNKRWWGAWLEQDTDALQMDYRVRYDVSRLSTVQNFITVVPPNSPERCGNCGHIDHVIDFNTAEFGITWIIDPQEDPDYSLGLISSPFDFESFRTESLVTWGGINHYDMVWLQQ